MKFYRSSFVYTAVLLTGSHAFAGPQTITFDDLSLEHGEIVAIRSRGGSITGFPGVSLSVDNFNDRLDLAVIFDTNESPTEDSDLESPFLEGNIPGDTPLGNILIIQERNRETVRQRDELRESRGRRGNPFDIGDIVRRPDDEGSRPAGTLTFTFDNAISSIGFDFLDVESTSDEPLLLTLSNGSTSVELDLFGIQALNTEDDFLLGDRRLNRVAPLLAADIDGLDFFTEVEFYFGGSGGLDNIVFEEAPQGDIGVLIPSPAAFGSGLFGATCLLLRRRRA